MNDSTEAEAQSILQYIIDNPDSVKNTQHTMSMLCPVCFKPKRNSSKPFCSLKCKRKDKESKKQ
jgi:hypothetical protein